MSKNSSAEIYTADCSYIEKLHGILHKANLVVMILEIRSEEHTSELQSL